MNFTRDPQFLIQYEPRLRPVADFQTECFKAVQTVLQDANNKPLVVMLSGGIDSELVAMALLLARVPFTAMIGRLCTQLNDYKIVFNDHDFKYAIDWCKKHNVEFFFCDIDIFKQGDLLCEYAVSANCFSPQYACHMHIMKHISDRGGFFLAGNGEMDIVKLSDGKYYMQDEERECCLRVFQTNHQLHGVAQFWKQDSYIISSFIQLPTVRRLMQEGHMSLLPFKYDCFSDVFVLEPRVKCTGFERIQEWDYILRSHLKTIVGTSDRKYYTPIISLMDSNYAN